MIPTLLEKDRNKLKDIILELELFKRQIQEIRYKCTDLISEAKQLGIAPKILNKVLKARQVSLLDKEQEDALVDSILTIVSK